MFDLRSRLRDDRGGALVLTAIALASLVLVVAFVVDIANWFVHKRHLQLQADAAALAGGTAFAVPGCDNAAIYNAVRQYAGVRDLTYASPYNMQVGGTPDGNVHIRVNSTGYYNDGAVDYSDGGQPCAAGMVDVKMTETNLPWFLSNAFVPAINAHARVSFNSVDTVKGNLPLGVPDVNPHSAAVIFYDEASGDVLAARYLRKTGSAGGLTTWANVDSTGDAQPASVTMPSSGRVGAVVALSTKGPPPTGTPPMSISGTLSQICGQSRVDCFDATGGTVNNGLLFMHGYTAGNAGNVPSAEAATLLNTTPTCADYPYGYYFYGVTGDCSIRLSVEYGWETGVGQAAQDIKLTAFGGACGNNGCDAASVLGENPALFNIPVTAGSGANPITIEWAVRRGSINGTVCGTSFNNTDCKGSFGIVQRAFAGDDDISGPIRIARLLNMGAPFDAGPLGTCPGPLGSGPACHSLEKDHTYSLAVSVQIAGAIATSVSDPAVALRVVGRSQNGSIDCDSTGNLRDQIEKGCQVFYKINTDPAGACPYTPQNKSGMFSTPQPYVCVATQTGGSVGQFTQGIQNRILGPSSPTCPLIGQPGYNYWSTWPNLPLGNADPRLILVFLVPFGSFRSSGNELFPVVGFGEFYVTGWGGNGAGNDDPCPGADPAPQGYLMGHFVNRPLSSSQATGTQPCSLTSLIPCVAVLTK